MKSKEPIPNFNAGDAFSFIKEKTGRTPPKKYVLKKLKQGQIQDLSIPEDLGDDPELILVYKILYEQQTLTPEELSQGLLDLDLSYCDLQTLPNGLQLRKLNIRNTSIRELPSDLKVILELNARDCMNLKAIPKSLSSKGLFIDLQGCTSLEKIPKGFKAKGLIIYDCTSLKTLPDGLQIKGPLACSGCASLEGLPRSMKVRGSFSADDRTLFISKKFKDAHDPHMADAIRHYIEKELNGKVRNVYYSIHIAPMFDRTTSISTSTSVYPAVHEQVVSASTIIDIDTDEWEAKKDEE